MTGTVLDNVDVIDNSTIAAGGFVAQSGSFQLPTGFTTSHNLIVTVMADVNGNVLENQ